jgi:hypothetical protein
MRSSEEVWLYWEKIQAKSASAEIRLTSLDIWNISGSLSVSGFYLDNDTQAPVFTDSIRLPLELFVGRQAVNPREHDVMITKDMLLGLLRQLWDYRQQQRTTQ